MGSLPGAAPSGRPGDRDTREHGRQRRVPGRRGSARSTSRGCKEAARPRSPEPSAPTLRGPAEASRPPSLGRGSPRRTRLQTPRAAGPAPHSKAGAGRREALQSQAATGGSVVRSQTGEERGAEIRAPRLPSPHPRQTQLAHRPKRLPARQVTVLKAAQGP